MTLTKPAAPRRVLVISYHFGTEGPVGGIRWNRLSKYLSQSGSKVHVVCGAPTGSAFPPGVQGHHCPRNITLRDRYLAWRQRSQRTGGEPSQLFSPSPSSPSRGSWFHRVSDRVRLEAAVLLTTPDEARGWTMQAARLARRIIRREKIELVISSGPPHLAHVAAWLATRGSLTPWMADLRDPWGYHPDASAWADEPMYRSIVNRSAVTLMEHVTFKACSGVLCTNPPFAEALAKRYPGLTVTALPNGIDDGLLPKRLAGTTNSQAPCIVHVGTIYGKRDLRPIIQAAGEMIKGMPTNGPVIRIRAVGDVPDDHAEELRTSAKEAGPGLDLDIVPSVDRAAAWEILRGASAAVVLAQSQPYQVPAKLYEAAWLTPVVLVLAEPQSATWIEGRQLGAIALDPTEIGEITAVLHKLKTETLTKSHFPAERTYPLLSQQLAQIIDDVTTKPRARRD